MHNSEITAIDHALLDDISFGLLLLDAQQQVQWINNAALRLLDVDESTALGSPAVGLSLQPLLDGAQRLLQVGNGARVLSGEIQRNSQGEQLVVLSDVSEHERLAAQNTTLQRQVEELKLTDDMTGLPNKRAISQALELHISRSRRYQNPLSVVLVHLELQHFGAAQPLSAEPAILAVSRFLRDRLRWVDQIARWEDNIFLLVLPETSEADARGLLEKIGDEQDSMLLPEGYAGLRPALGFGLACWSKGDDMRTLLRSALDDLRSQGGD